MRKLSRDFYFQPTLKVARGLLGKYLVRSFKAGTLVGRIVEVEAYLGERDPASHAYRGRSPRNEVMYRMGGHLYVYFTYGMHFCSNVVTEQEGIPRAVLLRALEPIEGIEIIRNNRRKPESNGRSHIELCNGPGKLCQAFAIGRWENGTDLCGNAIWLAEADKGTSRPLPVAVSTRVGITRGQAHRWRFYIKDNPYVSRGKPVVHSAIIAAPKSA